MRISPAYKLENAVSKDELRPAMQKIRIEDGLAIATDGHILAAVSVEMELGDENTLLHPMALQQARKLQEKSEKDDDRLIIECNGSTSIPTPDGMLQVVYNDNAHDTYPNWQSVMPQKKERTFFAVGINAKLLFNLAKALGSDKVILRFDSSPSRSVYVEADGNPDAKGLVMPFRFGYGEKDTDECLPDKSFEAPKKEQKAAEPEKPKNQTDAFELPNAPKVDDTTNAKASRLHKKARGS